MSNHRHHTFATALDRAALSLRPGFAQAAFGKRAGVVFLILFGWSARGSMADLFWFGLSMPFWVPGLASDLGSTHTIAMALVAAIVTTSIGVYGMWRNLLVMAEQPAEQ